MASLNLSANGPAIKNSYQKVVDAPPPSGPSAQSTTYGQWAVFTVQAPLASAFQNDSNKESVLKVQTTGEGELLDLIEEFSDGRIQFAFVKIKDTNSGLPKSVLIAWCGEGVPERTKGYFTSHLTAVSKLLHGYHVQITARSDRDLTPESILQKVADSSGSKYTGGPASSDSTSRPTPPVASKPVFMPNKVGGAGGFAPLGRSRAPAPSGPTDSDGWGEDAPQVTRSQLEKVQSAYKPTKVNMAELTSQKQQPSRFEAPSPSNGNPDVVRGGYQPIGKVDLAAIRKEAKEKGELKDDRPTIVKGSYEPIGKVDIAAIRAKAQGGQPQAASPPPQQEEEERPRSLADRSAAFQSSERITSMPKPKVANKFGGSSSFTGTKAPTPGGFGDNSPQTSAPLGGATRSFAESAGKSPAQIWAEKKARERGSSGAADTTRPSMQPTSPVTAQKSGGWQSSYTGKKWGDVQTNKTGASSASLEHEPAHEDREEEAPSGGVGSIADRFNQAPPPPLDTSSKPSAGPRGIAMPGLPIRTASTTSRPEEEHVDLPTPPAQPRSPSPDVPSHSPPRIAMPVSRTAQPEPIETSDPPAIPASAIPVDEEPEPEPEEDPARGAAQAAAESSFGAGAATANPGAAVGGKRAVIAYDYEKAEDNEIELREGEYVTDIEMVDEDWWMGRNSAGETGLFPSNYVELVEDGHAGAQSHAAPSQTGPAPTQQQEPVAPPAGPPGGGLPTATAQYDYDAAEDNEISFPEGAKIEDVVS
ncbi:hypothetical protein K461DRAFT_72240 [Myriangium duriaei CBS 260.36]|uniref:SH3 domain-containing protein n=1 Tax=Myriangium duriaei CBS 260.36 TaxID=1168546 RepID=A0A9P4MBN8_9PEZI|nr:hypothetical protein K461DRAFT_72240 [Myriangium duriaei CBS 260.36]